MLTIILTQMYSVSSPKPAGRQTMISAVSVNAVIDMYPDKVVLTQDSSYPN